MHDWGEGGIQGEGLWTCWRELTVKQWFEFRPRKGRLKLLVPQEFQPPSPKLYGIPYRTVFRIHPSWQSSALDSAGIPRPTDE